MNSFSLDDPRENARVSPYTYFLPSAERLAALRPGDLVKLVFRPVAQNTKWDCERMWVQVRAENGDRLAGVLDNDPDDIPGLKAGDPVQFLRWHIIAVLFAPDRSEAPPPPDAHREYWERCMVDQAVIDGELKVDYLYREEPDLGGPDDTYPDSGWRIRGDMRNATEEKMDARKAAYVALGLVLNRDDSWLHLIDQPKGSAFRRNFEDDTYVSVAPSSGSS